MRAFIAFLLAFLLTPAAAGPRAPVTFGASSTVQTFTQRGLLVGEKLSDKDNYVKNASCWKSTTGITASGTGATIARNDVLPLGDVSDCSFNLGTTSSGYIEWTVDTLPAGLASQQCALVVQANTLAKTGTSTATWQVLQGGIVVSSIEQPASTASYPVFLMVPCGASSTLSTTIIRLAQTSYTSGVTTGKSWGVWYGDARKSGQYGDAANITPWTPYTPTITGFGTVSGISISYRNVGDTMELGGKFVCGTPTATTALIGLPSGSTTASVLPLNLAGKWVRNNGSTNLIKQGAILAEPNATSIYVTLDDYSFGSNPYGATSGNLICLNGETVSFFARLPITNSPTALKAVTPAAQNLFSGGQWTGGFVTGVTSGTFALVSGLTGPTNIGSGTAASTTAAFTTPALPAGEYEVEAHFQLDVANSQATAGATASCQIGISDDGGSTVPHTTTQSNITSVAGLSQRNSANSVKGTFKYTSAQAAKTFGLYVRRTGGASGATCEVYAPISFNLRPYQLNPSPLYVMSPVRAAGTGIQPNVGEVGYKIEASGSSTTVGSATNLTNILVPVGSWHAFIQVTANINTAGATDYLESVLTTSGPTATSTGTLSDNKMWTTGNASGRMGISYMVPILATSATTYYLHSVTSTSGTTNTAGRIRLVRQPDRSN